MGLSPSAFTARIRFALDTCQTLAHLNMGCFRNFRRHFLQKESGGKDSSSMVSTLPENPETGRQDLKGKTFSAKPCKSLSSKMTDAGLHR